MSKYFALIMSGLCVVLLSNAGVFAQSTESASDRVKREEKERTQADIAAENEKITRINEIVLRTFKAGNEALKAGRYVEAIAQYDEGLAADPEHPGAALMLTNKSVALRGRGVALFNAAVGFKDEMAKASGLEEAKKLFRAAVESATKATQMIKASAVPTEPTAQTRYNANKYFALAARAQAMRLLVTKVDPSQAAAGFSAYQEYLAMETAPEKNLKGQLEAAQMLLDAQVSDKALAEFQRILTGDPNNLDALLGAGMALFDIDNKASYPEAAKYFQRFLALAPETHRFRTDVQAILDRLKSEDEGARKKKP